MAKKKTKVSMRNTKKEILKAYNELKSDIKTLIDAAQLIKDENDNLIKHNFSILDEMEELRQKFTKKESTWSKIKRWVRFE